MGTVDTLDFDAAIAAARAEAADLGIPAFVSLPLPGDERRVRTIVVTAAGLVVDTDWLSNNDRRMELIDAKVQCLGQHLREP